MNDATSIFAGALVAALLFAACQRGDVTELPLVDLEGAEPALVAVIDDAARQLRADPGSAAAWGRLGTLFDLHGFLAPAVQCYVEAERLDPNDFQWPYYRGICQLLASQNEALAAFERAASLHPDYAPIHVYIGRGRLLTGNLEGARAAFTRAAELDPSMIRAHLGLTKVALAENRAPVALDHVQAALRLDPQSAEPFDLGIAVHARLGNDAERTRYTQLAARRSGLEAINDPVRAQLGWTEGVTLLWRRKRAAAHISRGQLQPALDEWQAIAREHAQLAEAHAQAGNLLAQLGQSSAAIASLERALAIDPALHETRSNLGSLLAGAGQIDTGLAHLRTAADSLANSASARYNLAAGLRLAARLPEAVESYTQALRLDPTLLRARFELGVVLAQQRQLDDAVIAFRAVVDADPQRTAAQVNLARALTELGRFGEAVDVCRGALPLMPEQLDLANNLAWILATSPDRRHRDASQALTIAQRICQRTEHRVPVFLETLAAATAATGDHAGAAAHATTALALLPEAPEHDVVRQRLRSARQGYEQARPYIDTR